jgi:SIR2-like domain
MASKTILSKHWKLIVERIYEKFCGCVPFLGAAVNVGCPGYSGLPLGAELNRYLVEKLLNKPVASLLELAKVSRDKALDDYDDLVRVGLEDLARVALHYQFEMDVPSLINHLRTAIPDDDREPSKLLQVLARRRFELIVTTNYDRLMERALKEAKRPFFLWCNQARDFRTRSG